MFDWRQAAKDRVNKEKNYRIAQEEAQIDYLLDRSRVALKRVLGTKKKIWVSESLGRSKCLPYNRVYIIFGLKEMGFEWTFATQDFPIVPGGPCDDVHFGVQKYDPVSGKIIFRAGGISTQEDLGKALIANDEL